MSAGSKSMERDRVKALQRKAEKFFYNHILRELKEQFQEFVEDQVFAQFLDDKTKRLIDDLIKSIGKVKIDKLKAIKFFSGKTDLFHQIIECLRDVPQNDKLLALFESDDMGKRYLLPLTLRPHGAEGALQKEPEADPVTTSIIMEVLSRWLDFARGKKATLSILVEELEKIKENEFEHYTALPAIISEMKEHTLAYTELVVILEDTVNKTIAHPEMKPTFKRYFWEKVIVQSIELINDFCHVEACAKHDCLIIHDLTINKTAELLKIIYPEHFTEDIAHVASQIKTRYLEIRYGKTEADTFIRQLYSRYSEDRGRVVRVEETPVKPDETSLEKPVEEAPREEPAVAAEPSEELFEGPVLTEIEAGAIKDPLTGLYNKRFLLDAGAALYATAIRNKFNIAVFVVGIVGYENISEDVRDVAAKKYSSVLKKLFKRQSDIVTRTDDDMFCVVTSYDSAERLDGFTDNLRNQMEQLIIKHKGTEFSFNTSVGVCRQALETFEKMFQYADDMMHMARESEEQIIYTEDGSFGGQVLSLEAKRSRGSEG